MRAVHLEPLGLGRSGVSQEAAQAMVPVTHVLAGVWFTPKFWPVGNAAFQ